ncbi:unnamed protein product [Brassicogethes aeneus]|uniref:Solute carrier family 25 member 51 n=1 Tax=Brassicogethes aeneus TaxID=1431903 RepID=A0A9P0FEM6_BRAAE|nr:unnamed protein product [Brassicogethes aeneus]
MSKPAVVQTCQREAVLTKKDVPGKEYLAGLFSGFMSVAVTYPMTKFNYRQILDRTSFKDTLLKMYSEGHSLLFRGILPPLLHKSIQMTIMFGTYSQVHRNLEKLIPNQRYNQILSSVIAASVESSIMPFERVQTVLIYSNYNKNYKNMFDAFVKIQKKHGTKELYRGYTVIWIRNSSSNLCFFFLRDKFHEITVNYNNLPLLEFIGGAFCGTTMSMVFYPIKVLKTAIHKEVGTSISYTRTLMEVYREKIYFRGWMMNGFKSLVSWGVSLQSYEFALRLLSNIK